MPQGNTPLLGTYKIFMDVYVNYQEEPIEVYLFGYNGKAKLEFMAEQALDDSFNGVVNGFLKIITHEKEIMWIKADTIRYLKTRVMKVGAKRINKKKEKK